MRYVSPKSNVQGRWVYFPVHWAVQDQDEKEDERI